jgi:hypothetical protein
MSHLRDVARETCFAPPAMNLSERIAAAVGSRTTPISQLLRLMRDLDAQGGDEGLRRLLRMRIGAPLDA